MRGLHENTAVQNIANFLWIRTAVPPNGISQTVSLSICPDLSPVPICKIRTILIRPRSQILFLTLRLWSCISLWYYRNSGIFCLEASKSPNIVYCWKCDYRMNDWVPIDNANTRILTNRGSAVGVASVGVVAKVLNISVNNQPDRVYLWFVWRLVVRRKSYTAGRFPSLSCLQLQN